MNQIFHKLLWQKKILENPLVWSIIQLFSKQIINIVVLFILSFLITPTDFGIFSLAMSMFLFLSLLADTGFNAAIIQKQNISNVQLTTIYYINIMIAFFLFIAGSAIAIPFSHYYKIPLLFPILSILNISLVFISISSTHAALLQKKLEFKLLTIRDFLAVISGGLAALILAIFDFGIWVLVIQSIIMYFVSAVSLQFLSSWKPNKINFSFTSIKELFSYSKNIFIFNLLKYFAQNIDLLYIGYFLGPKDAGLYAIFYKLIIMPFSMLSGSIGNYIFARYAAYFHLHDISSLKRNFISLFWKQNIILIPLVMVVGLACTLFLDYGIMPQWNEAKNFIPWMCGTVILQIIISPIGSFLKALGRADYLLLWSVLFLIEICIGLYVLYKFEAISIIHVLMVIIIAYSINLLLMLIFIFKALNENHTK